ncbi:DUF962 domain-containing protein [Aurantiacibacter gangjinensis]|uniref:Membrane protein n=1 Tax=Aurantiacibacter gangjinensis TaxID=502682 RepID=A0A0G9MTQ7_9SPHN|nr:Mpo1-like protein [Aurantiacibacter gangjinensis]APE28469.1 hypothetical protein BMF35_a1640 [Aurantiacibacter gangjinensis]KLE32678.1 membrane protein [Aurantiacibacter gangjinensis]
MTALAETLAGYGEYHRDHRNVLTHAVGVPMIVLALDVLLARPVFTMPLLGVELTPAIIVSALAAVWYLQLDLKAGLLMTVLLAVFVALGAQIAAISTLAWLGGGIALFVVGWAFQFIGHHWEGRKPAFVDDLRGLLHGPLFMAYEGLWALGLAKGTKREVDALYGSSENRLRSS